MTDKTAARKIAFDGLTFGPRFAYGEMAGVTEVVGGGDGTALGTGREPHPARGRGSDARRQGRSR